MNRTRIAPPLAITEEDLVRGLDIIDEALGEIAGYAG
ncbi:putative aminotransferase [Corynebacterium halotolerans YIM 70093 = DSM 44683]|uniref:Putative aminotransferase n=1 Tax=Corynebacterium halotolerans YIM 70093 = DSM 44683 TaxID=1121362 RepID=M1MTS6_9CORY|nr:putative aminotransferase [Corynebacterium halotolerans YIM 70093 = DSM 44683]